MGEIDHLYPTERGALYADLMPDGRKGSNKVQSNLKKKGVRGR